MADRTLVAPADMTAADMPAAAVVADGAIYNNFYSASVRFYRQVITHKSEIDPTET